MVIKSLKLINFTCGCWLLVAVRAYVGVVVVVVVVVVLEASWKKINKITEYIYFGNGE